MNIWEVLRPLPFLLYNNAPFYFYIRKKKYNRKISKQKNKYRLTIYNYVL